MEISKQELQDILISIDSEDTIKIDYVEMEQINNENVFTFKGFVVNVKEEKHNLMETLDIVLNPNKNQSSIMIDMTVEKLTSIIKNVIEEYLSNDRFDNTLVGRKK